MHLTFCAEWCTMYTGGDAMESVRVQIRLPEEILEELDKRAKDRGLNRSAMIRLLIRNAAQSGAVNGGDYDPPLTDH